MAQVQKGGLFGKIWLGMGVVMFMLWILAACVVGMVLTGFEWVTGKDTTPKTKLV